MRLLCPNFLFLTPVSGGRRLIRVEAAPSLPTILVPGDGEWPPDVFQGPDVEHVPKVLLQWFQ